MAIRKIVVYGEDDVLRKRARAVDKFDARLATLLDDMAETLHYANGAGLAAPQVGVLKRVAIVDVGEGLMELVNPEIVASEGEDIVVEGCLSLPGKCGTIARPEKVVVRALDRNGNPVEYAVEGFAASAVCHELDHLDGVLYVDKMIEDVSDRYRQVKGDESE